MPRRRLAPKSRKGLRASFPRRRALPAWPSPERVRERDNSKDRQREGPFPPVLTRGENDVRSLRVVRSLSYAIRLIVKAYRAFLSCTLVYCNVIASPRKRYFVTMKSSQVEAAVWCGTAEWAQKRSLPVQQVRLRVVYMWVGVSVKCACVW